MDRPNNSLKTKFRHRRGVALKKFIFTQTAGDLSMGMVWIGGRVKCVDKHALEQVHTEQ